MNKDNYFWWALIVVTTICLSWVIWTPIAKGDTICETVCWVDGWGRRVCETRCRDNDL